MWYLQLIGLDLDWRHETGSWIWVLRFQLQYLHRYSPNLVALSACTDDSHWTHLKVTKNLEWQMLSQNCSCSEKYIDSLPLLYTQQQSGLLICTSVQFNKKARQLPWVYTQLLIATGTQVSRLNLPEDRNLTYFTIFTCFFLRHYKLSQSWQRTSTSKVVLDFTFIFDLKNCCLVWCHFFNTTSRVTVQLFFHFDVLY